MSDDRRIELPAATTALVVIDLQKGIVSRRVEPHDSATVVANTAKLLAAQRARGGFVVLVRVAFSADGLDRLRPVSDDPGLAAAGTPPPDFSELVPELRVQPSDHVLDKRQWGAFHATDLDLQLRRRGITTIVLCGIATCYGCESTARGAFELGYQQIFVEDAMASMTAADHEHTIRRIFPRIGRVRSTAEVLAALG